MSVYKRGKYWWIHVEVGGKTIRQSARTQEKKKATEIESKIRARLHDDVHAQMTGRAPKRTFGEALQRWMEGEAKALKSYDNLLDKALLISPYLEDVLLFNVPDEAETMKHEFINKGLKPATINRRLAIVKRVLKLAFKWNWLDSSIASKITLLPENNERHIYLSPDQVNLLAFYAGEAGPVVLYLAYSGLRKSELLRLQPENKQDDLITLDGNTKSGKPRVIPIPEIIQNIPLPITLNDWEIRKHFERARSAIGLDHIHLHDLRHTYASWLIKSKAGLTAVRDVLGHAHLGVTSRYSHLEPTELRKLIHGTFAVQSGPEKESKDGVKSA